MDRTLMSLAVLLAAVLAKAQPVLPVQPAPPKVEAVSAAPLFAHRVVVAGLKDPFEVVWGPDGQLWVTERTAGRVVRIDPMDGTRTTLLTLSNLPQKDELGLDELLGMALHPELLQGTGHDHVYLAYTYKEEGHLRAKISRYTYDPVSHGLSEPMDLIAGLPASDDHNGGRLIHGPDGRLYYSVGDQGHGQFAHACIRNRAQDLPSAAQVAQRDWSTYQGKILRLELDGAVPVGNPVLEGLRSHIYSCGHRNPQGLAFGPSGLLYASEHGPKTDDEVNLIEPGGNYGWPHIAGYRDDRAYEHADWAAAPECGRLTYSSLDLPESVPRSRETAWSHPDFVPPLRTFFTVDDGYDFRGSGCGNPPNICWPSIAPSSLKIYEPRDGVIPGWGKSLLLPSLKHGAVYRVELSADGRSTTGEPEALFRTINRYRQVTTAADGLSFYIATDSSGVTRSRDGGRTVELEHPGAILEFRYTGQDTPAAGHATHRAPDDLPLPAGR